MNAAYEQRRRALIAANRVRFARAGMKHNLRMLPTQEAARLRAAEIIESPPPAAVGMRVEELLLACRRMGPKYMRRYLEAARVDGSRTIGSLSERERGALCALLRLGVAVPGDERVARHRERKAVGAR